MVSREQDHRAPICSFYSRVQAVGELTLASDVGHPPLQHQQACMRARHGGVPPWIVIGTLSHLAYRVKGKSSPVWAYG